jgi:hypothetical protein
MGTDVKIIAGCSNWFVLFIWFIWSIWFNQTNETNQINQITVFSRWRTFSASCYPSRNCTARGSQENMPSK